MANNIQSSDPVRRHKVVVCRDLGPDVMPLLRERRELELIVWPEDKFCDRKWLLENIPGCSGVLVMLSDIVNEEFLDTCGPSLKVVSTMSVGYDHVKLPALAQRGIKLGYTPDVLTDAVADLSVMLALMASRNAKQTLSVVQNGEWPSFSWAPFAFCGRQISSSSQKRTITVGFLGFGRIAKATLARLVPFGINHVIFLSSPKSKRDSPNECAEFERQFGVKSVRRTADLQELARESDIVFVLAPGGPSTHHIIDEYFLRAMKPTAVLVNPSRGTLVDSDALAKAVHEGWIWGAGLDVVEGEPNVTADHPLVKEPRCVVLPHVGSATFETRLEMASLAARNLIAGVLGEELEHELGLQSYTSP
ncbi:hypothetical protein BD410DRAFT_785974 [Rickenella mellea]|uniref:Glyoxylate reductase n=1 Tax=Rickenella mellea TaxID=50990 RepID=A0A4Y7QA72_9AGAM|nr:hypothetical protein BD410DRAFT_785974 [Rickenella mellea]